MNDLGAELAAIAADLRAVLEEARSRGVLLEEAADLPTAIPWVGEGPPIEAPAALASARDAWVEIAAEAEAPPPRETLDAIRADLGDCRRCGLCKDRHNLVFGVGTPAAELVIVGEGPGHDEDLKGEPFVGPAGQMLDRMLSNVLGLAREQVYIANVVKCRPPGNRNPLPDEIAMCLPYLHRQLESIRPKWMLVLGSVALRALFGQETGIMKARGQWLEWRGIAVMPTFHPAYLLRNPDEKKRTFEDLKLLKARMAQA